MNRLNPVCLTLLLFSAALPSTRAFSYLGPFKIINNGYFQDWQVGAIGYQLAGDIGGPMEAMEGYRWNTPTVTYAYDRSFLAYFGTNGVNAVEGAIAILNNLPPASQITNDAGRLYIRGQPVPFDTKRVNYRAEALGMVDVKSWALRNLVEEMGLAEPERWCFGIRGRRVLPGNIPQYSVVKMNYDPITLQPTNRVNEATYSYIGIEPLQPGNYADALDFAVDPFAPNYSSVAGLGTVQVLAAPLFQGVYFDALSHDDVGGLRWLLSPNNIAVEVLLPGSLAGSGISAGGGAGSTAGSTWAPAVNLTNSAGTGVWNPVVILTNVPGVTNVPPGTTITNDLSTVPLIRPGVDKIQFQRVAFDSLLGNTFTPITVRWTDRFFSGGRFVSQAVARTVNQPDIVFRAGDPGLAGGFAPALSDRTTTAGWTNMAAFNGRQDALGGPGIVVPPIEILFSDLLPFFITINGEIEPPPDTLLGPLFSNYVWGSFDGSTNPPIVYPQRLNLTPQELQAYIARFTRTP